MIDRTFFLFFFFITLGGVSQTAPNKFLVRFSDKIGSPFSLSHPSEYLSYKSLDRRAQSGIAIEESDIPVNPSYISAVLATGQVQLLHRSRWFNSVSILTADSAALLAISALPFVLEIRKAEVLRGSALKQESLPANKSQLLSPYGEASNQTAMVNGHMLHGAGFRGRGMDVAVLDAGFSKTDSLSAFDNLRTEGRIIPVWDFVDNDEGVFHGSGHGTFVLSIMAGIVKDSLVGSAPEATYYLFRSEEGATEYLVEEDNWTAAAEMADSLGVWVINSSLGYSIYDDSTMNHSYSDMNGNSTRITRAAAMAARKGILVVTSAGNSGSNVWHYITAPADADSVLAVGAVDSQGVHTSFSSFGPSFDGRVKPNVCAQGRDASYANMTGGVSQGNGTSFSSPVICGFAACLWQWHPNRSNMEIISAIEQSASHFAIPNDSLGFGIPDFWHAHRILSVQEMDTTGLELSLFPNPFHDELTLVFRPSKFDRISAQVYDSFGRPIYRTESLPSSGGYVIADFGSPLSQAAPGLYNIVVLVDGLPLVNRKVVKY